MTLDTPQRVCLYTAVAVGGTLCGFAAGTFVGALAINNLASDIHDRFKRNKLTSLKNHDLQKLVGHALADLIGFYQDEHTQPNFLQKAVPAFRGRKGKELTALGKAARKHWDQFDLTGESAPLADENLHQAFDKHDRTTDTPYVTADEWDRHLQALAELVQDKQEKTFWLSVVGRRPLAEYIAPRFAAAVRELVKADLDKDSPFGGRVFVAVHLDMMHAMAVDIRKIDTKQDAQLNKLVKLQNDFDALRQVIIDKLDTAQKGEYFDLLSDTRTEIQTTRSVLSDKLDQLLKNQQGHTEKLDTIIQMLQQERDTPPTKRRSEDDMREQITGEIEQQYADKLAQERSAREAAERAAQAVLDVKDIPGIVEALREKGGQAIIDGLLEKAKTSPATPDATIELHRKVAEWAYLIGNIDQALASLNIILANVPNDLDATDRLGHIFNLRGDLPAAEKQYRRLLEIVPDDLIWRATALRNLGVVALTRGNIDSAEKLHRESLVIDRKLGRLDGQASNLGNLGMIAWTRSDFDEAEKLLRESLDLFRTLGFLQGQAAALGNLGLIAQSHSDFDAAENFHRESFEIECKLGRLEGKATQLTNLGLISQSRGNVEHAEKMHRESFEIECKLGRLLGQAASLGNLGVVAMARSDFDAAENYHLQSLKLHRQLNRLEGQAADLGNLGNIAQSRGDLAAAESLYRESLDINYKLDRVEGQAITLGNLAGIAYANGDFETAEKLYRDGHDLHCKIGHREGQAASLTGLGLIAHEQNELDAAEKLLRESLGLFRKLGIVDGQASALGNLGAVLLSRGDLDGAETLLSESLEFDRKLGRLEYQAIALSNLGGIAQMREDIEGARMFWTAGRDLYTQIEIPHMVEQLQGWLDSLPPA